MATKMMIFNTQYFKPMKKKSSLSQPVKGFTLVELLVVIVIIATLAGLVAAIVPRMRKKANSVTSTNNLKQIGLAITNYTNETGYFPGAFCSFDRLILPNLGVKFTNAQYGEDLAANNTAFTKTADSNIQSVASLFTAPNDSTVVAAANFKLSYLIASWAILSDPNDMSSAKKRISINKCNDASNAFILTEAFNAQTMGTVGGVSDDFTLSIINAARPVDYYNPNGKINVLFVDGHVESISRPRDAAGALLLYNQYTGIKP
jgi:prepilin-type N-terminal cleavage/methylation domain-containing protein/prepilin-type processing-associated H-X9-DG protein